MDSKSKGIKAGVIAFVIYSAIYLPPASAMLAMAGVAYSGPTGKRGFPWDALLFLTAIWFTIALICALFGFSIYKKSILFIIFSSVVLISPPIMYFFWWYGTL